MKRAIGEKQMKAQCCAVIKKAMGGEGREVTYAEIVQFLRENSQNELLWLCMAGALEGKQRFECLERALRINPQNEKTFRLMKMVNLKRAYKVARRMNLFDADGNFI
jgi:hypothetical protein